MKTIAKYLIFLLIGALLGDAGYRAFADWEWWAWSISMMASVYARDLVMSA